MPEKGIEIFTLNIEEISRSDLRAAFFLMSDERKGKCKSLMRDEDKMCCIAADMLLRDVLSERTGIPREELVFGREEKGKPYLVNGDYFFSVSHAGKYVCIAVSDKGNIGVDIEHMKGMKYALMRHFCTEEDVRFIMGEKPADTAVMTDYEMILRFFTVWTYKEAYVKCTGEGFTDTVLKISYDKNRCTTKILEDYVICAVEAQEL